MQKLDNLYKGAGKGKIAAVIGVTSCNSFRKMGIKNVCLKLYRDYLINHVGYDKVYIIASSNKEQKINEEYFDKDSIVFGIETPNLFNDLKIDDIFSKQHVLVFFGGKLGDYYFSICNRLCEWYEKHGDGHYYTIQDDPDFLTINPALLVDRRIDGTIIRKERKSKAKPYSYKRERPDVPLYLEFNKQGTLHKCFNNTIIAHCGNNYPLYYKRAISVGIGTPNIKTEPKYWDTFNVYNWQGVNDNLDKKFVDYDWKEKKYVSEYHGYIKHDKFRISTTLDFYNALNQPIMVIEARGHFSDDFNKADKIEEVEYNDLFATLGKNSKSSFIIANASTFDDFISPRYFDLMLSDIIPFVFTAYDSQKVYTDNQELKDFMYVDTPEDFVQKVNKISIDEKYYKHIKYLQRKSIYDNFKQYMNKDSKKKFEEFLGL